MPTFRFDLISKSMAKEQNKFLLVHLLAKRMHQLADGANSVSSVTHSSKFNTAMQEFLEDKLQFKEQVSLDVLD
jgi:DNA-directed RNA polymerase subunit K/omega